MKIVPRISTYAQCTTSLSLPKVVPTSHSQTSFVGRPLNSCFFIGKVNSETDAAISNRACTGAIQFLCHVEVRVSRFPNDNDWFSFKDADDGHAKNTEANVYSCSMSIFLSQPIFLHAHFVRPQYLPRFLLYQAMTPPCFRH